MGRPGTIKSVSGDCFQKGRGCLEPGGGRFLRQSARTGNQQPVKGNRALISNGGKASVGFGSPVPPWSHCSSQRALRCAPGTVPFPGKTAALPRVLNGDGIFGDARGPVRGTFFNTEKMNNPLHHGGTVDTEGDLFFSHGETTMGKMTRPSAKLLGNQATARGSQNQKPVSSAAGGRSFENHRLAIPQEGPSVCALHFSNGQSEWMVR